MYTVYLLFLFLSHNSASLSLPSLSLITTATAPREPHHVHLFEIDLDAAYPSHPDSPNPASPSPLDSPNAALHCLRLTPPTTASRFLCSATTISRFLLQSRPSRPLLLALPPAARAAASDFSADFSLSLEFLLLLKIFDRQSSQSISSLLPLLLSSPNLRLDGCTTSRFQSQQPRPTSVKFPRVIFLVWSDSQI